MAVFPPEVREHLNGRRRFVSPVTIHDTEHRSDGTLSLRGHAAVFHSDSEPIFGMFIERIARGAFRKVIGSRPDVRLLFNHDGQPMARTSNGTLALTEDNAGLAFDAQIADTTLGRDIHTLVQRGDLDQMSFAFTVAEDTWTYATDGNELDERMIIEIRELFEISVVTFPAYRDTDVVATTTSDAATGDRSGETDAQQAAQGSGEQQGERGASAGEDGSPDRSGAVDTAARDRARREIDFFEVTYRELGRTTGRDPGRDAEAGGR